MAFTSEELTRMTNAALDWYLTPDNLTPLERSRQRLKAARRALEAAQAELAAALEYKVEVRRMPYAERHKRWDAPKTRFSGPFVQAAPVKSLLRELFPEEDEDASGS